MADDPVEAARRRTQRMLARSTYFPAANLRQFEGTELAPPGGGTYYNPSRYAGAPYGNRRMAERNLAGAYQSDLAFNVMSNPRIARGLEAERIGAQYASGPVGSGRATPETTRDYYSGHSTVNRGLRTITLPSGGTATVLDSPSYGGGRGAQQSYFPAANLLQNPFSGPLNQGTGFQFGTPQAQSPQIPSPLSRRFASEQGDLRRDIEGTFYGGGQAPPTPTPTPVQSPRFAYGEPTRYFDSPYA